MANYKVVNADQLDADMKTVADAIRAKAGTTTDMQFPDGYISVIENIKDGVKLPTLINPGTEADALLNKEFINQAGEIVAGTIISKSADSVTVSGKTVKVPSGYYPESVSKDVASVDQATPEISVSSSGLITASATQKTGYVENGTKSAVKQLSVKAAEEFTPTTKNQTIPAGLYLTGTQKILGDPNLKAENIADGVTIFNIEGTHVGGIVPDGTKTVTANGVHDVTEYEFVSVELPTAAQATPSISVDDNGKITATVTQSTTGIVEKGTKTATKNLSVQETKSVSPTTSDQVVVGAGKYTTGEISVKGDANLTPENIKSGTSIFGVTGTYAPQPSSVQSLFPTITVSSNGLIEAEAAVESAYYNEGSYSSQKQLNTKGYQSWTPTTKNQTIPTGTYLTGDQVIIGDSNLVASNIANGVSLFGLTGTFSGLPSRISEIKQGIITPPSDVSYPYELAHGLNSHADFYLIWHKPSTTMRAGYLTFGCGFFTKIYNYSNAPQGYVLDWYIDSNGAQCVAGTSFPTIDTSTTFPALSVIDAESGTGVSLKGGCSYYWIAGTFA